mgnify:CR=1 FL=1
MKIVAKLIKRVRVRGVMFLYSSQYGERPTIYSDYRRSLRKNERSATPPKQIN